MSREASLTISRIEDAIRKQIGVVYDVDPPLQLNQFCIHTGEKGSGSYGKVVKARHKQTNTIHAIKIFHEVITNENMESFETEYRLLSQINSDFVVEFRSAWIEGQRLYIQTEFCDYNLKKIIDAKNRYFSASSAASIGQTIDRRLLALIDYFIAYELFEELTKSLNYLHSLKPPIMHRDLKPENILVLHTIAASGRQFLKIGDFGYAKPYVYLGQSNSVDKGTVNYMAPEVSRGKHYDTKSDVYNLGLICIELFGLDEFQ
ncbi:unnamed protein product, partial [Medioppia subpectinata]